jgi:hypothetical protein
MSVKISQMTAASAVSRSDETERNQGGASRRATVLQERQATDIPAFLANNSADDSDVSGDSTTYFLICNQEVFDNAGDYNDTTGVFTAPVTGKYLLTFTVLFYGLTANHNDHQWGIQTSNRTYTGNDGFGAGANPFTQRSVTMSVVADMDAGDTAQPYIDIGGGTKVVDVANGQYTFFSGMLIG